MILKKFPIKAEENMSESRFLFSFQNVKKEANVIAYEERTQFRMMPKVSKVRI